MSRSVVVPEGFDIEALAASRCPIRMKKGRKTSGFMYYANLRQKQLDFKLSNDDLKAKIGKEWDAMGKYRRQFFKNIAK